MKKTLSIFEVFALLLGMVIAFNVSQSEDQCEVVAGDMVCDA